MLCKLCCVFIDCRRLTCRSAFPPGERRNHFLAISLPEKVEEERQKNAEVYKPADYGMSGLNFSYLPALAWVLMTLDWDGAPFPLQTDI